MKPRLVLVLCGKLHRHGFLMDGSDDIIALGGQKAIQEMLAFGKVGFGSTGALPMTSIGRRN